MCRQLYFYLTRSVDVLYCMLKVRGLVSHKSGKPYISEDSSEAVAVVFCFMIISLSISILKQQREDGDQDASS